MELQLVKLRQPQAKELELWCRSRGLVRIA